MYKKENELPKKKGNNKIKTANMSLAVFRWAHLDLNQGPAGYESDALTDWAMSPLL